MRKMTAEKSNEIGKLFLMRKIAFFVNYVVIFLSVINKTKWLRNMIPKPFLCGAVDGT